MENPKANMNVIDKMYKGRDNRRHAVFKDGSRNKIKLIEEGI